MVHKAGNLGLVLLGAMAAGCVYPELKIGKGTGGTTTTGATNATIGTTGTGGSTTSWARAEESAGVAQRARAVWRQ